MGDTTESRPTQLEDVVFDRWWFKIRNHDVLSDPAVVKLSDRSFRVFIQLLAVANDSKNLGEIPDSFAEIAFLIRVEEADLSTCVNELVGAGLVEVEGELVTIVRADVFYEGAGLTRSDSKEGRRERKRRSRARKAQAKANESACHRDVTVKSKNQNESQTQTLNRNQSEIVEVDTRTVPGRRDVGIRTSGDAYSAEAGVIHQPSEGIETPFEFAGLEQEMDDYFKAVHLDSEFCPSEMPLD